MDKYNFGGEIVSGSTMEWAFNIISEKASVLEIGPAVGTLTKHLKDEKGCLVDIVEIDAESGKMAAEYARMSCLGTERGDLEKDGWFHALSSNKYDYIVILDVLEHLRDPQRTLSRLKKLLDKDGEILLSIPNIAHNSVIINLINNRFQYTSVGLLDDTHVHFFTCESLLEMLNTCGLTAYRKECIQSLVGDNEIKNLYSDLSPELEAFLRTREYADVYQFLFRIKNREKGVGNPPLIVKQLPFTLYPLEIYDKNYNLLEIRRVNPCSVSEKFDLTSQSGRVRIDPLDHSCLLTCLELSGSRNEDKLPVPIIESNGIVLENGHIIFFDDDPQIIINADDISILEISYRCIGIDSPIIGRVENALKLQLDYKKAIGQLETRIGELSEANASKEKEISFLELQMKSKEEEAQMLIESLSEQSKELDAKNTSLVNELANIKSKRLWKLYEKLTKIGKEI